MNDQWIKTCQAITQVLFGTAAAIAATAFLFYATAPAQASPLQSQSTGSYQMDANVLNMNGDAHYWYVLVWNTETGRSRFYYGSPQIGTKAANGAFNLPSNPL